MKSISIIIPFYNGNKYINNTLKRIELNRMNLDPDIRLEVIIVNDSPSVKIDIDESILKYQVKVHINKKNVGIHSSRLNGLKLCTSEYVCFLDQDDDISSDYFKTQLDNLGEMDFVVGNGFNENQDMQRELLYKTSVQQKLCLNKTCYYLYSNVILSPGQVLMRRDAIPFEWTKCNFRYNGADDNYLWILMLEKGKKGTINSKPIYVHKFTGENASKNMSVMTASNMELIKCLKEQKLSPIKTKLLERRINYYSDCNTRFLKIRYIDVVLFRCMYRSIIRLSGLINHKF